MKELNLMTYPKFMDHYGPNDSFDTWVECLIDAGIKDPCISTGLIFNNITDEEYTWFVLRWS